MHAQVCAGPANSSITVLVTDECPQCRANELNLHAFAFEQISQLKYGSVAIQYRQVGRGGGGGRRVGASLFGWRLGHTTCEAVASWQY